MNFQNLTNVTNPMNPTTVSAIGPYLILNRIARGGMGTVYLARHAETQQIVALKLLSPQVGQNAEFLARFRREVNVMLGLRHPNIVEVYDAGVGAGADSSDDNAYYIAMAYLPYGNLKKEIARYAISGEPFPIDRTLEITRQIALALGYAHQRGLIHRDVKPSNILRAPGEHYVLTDFGIVLDLDATRLTRDPTASGIGTPEYMSPEQIEHRQTDARSDVYALGVVLYELIAGVAPFKADSPLVVLMKHVHEAPPPIAGYRADVP